MKSIEAFFSYIVRGDFATGQRDYTPMVRQTGTTMAHIGTFADGQRKGT